MSFISTTAHQKFISQCTSLIEETLQNVNGVLADDKAERLKADLAALQQLAEDYMRTFSQLPELTREYYILQRRIRVNMRKMQLIKPVNSPGK